MFAIIVFLLFMIMGYLMGSICSAVIVCRLFDLPDPRHEGSKNPGATNVLRLAGRQYAAMVLIGDMLKGLLPVLLAKLFGLSPAIVGFTCVAAVFGHMYPVFFGFKGGKGVATALGAMLGFHFMVGVLAIATWLLVANFTRYSSLASLVSVIFAPFYSLFVVGNASAFLPLVFIAIFIIYQHRENITRLMDGNETKIHFHRAKHPPEQSGSPPPSTITPAAEKPLKTPKKVASKKTTTAKKSVAPKKSTAAPKQTEKTKPKKQP